MSNADLVILTVRYIETLQKDKKMTDPKLSVESTKEIGRLYQKPDGEYAKKIRGSVAYEGIENGTLFPSITNIIGVASGDFSGWQMHEFWKAQKAGASVYDSAKAADNLRDFAAARGTAVHDVIDNMMSGGSQNVKDYPIIAEYKAEGYVEAYKAFRAAHPTYEPVMTEVTVFGDLNDYHHPGQYAGTVDAVFKDVTTGELIVVDWKCTSVLRQSVALQLSAVMNAEHMIKDGELVDNVACWTGDNFPEDIYIAKGVGVQLKADGTFHEAEVKQDESWPIFKCLLQVWYYKIYPNMLFKEMQP